MDARKARKKSRRPVDSREKKKKKKNVQHSSASSSSREEEFIFFFSPSHLETIICYNREIFYFFFRSIDQQLGELERELELNYSREIK